VEGLIGALAVRTRIQLALGVIMATEHVDADSAYAILRSRAAATALSLTAAAGSILTRAADRPPP
jgi:AmiR/NasT family two-component response regulator